MGVGNKDKNNKNNKEYMLMEPHKNHIVGATSNKPVQALINELEMLRSDNVNMFTAILGEYGLIDFRNGTICVNIGDESNTIKQMSYLYAYQIYSEGICCFFCELFIQRCTDKEKSALKKYCDSISTVTNKLGKNIKKYKGAKDVSLFKSDLTQFRKQTSINQIYNHLVNWLLVSINSIGNGIDSNILEKVNIELRKMSLQQYSAQYDVFVKYFDRKIEKETDKPDRDERSLSLDDCEKMKGERASFCRFCGNKYTDPSVNICPICGKSVGENRIDASIMKNMCAAESTLSYSATSTNDVERVAGQLRAYKSMLDEGLIDKNDYEKKKQQILGLADR